jgi:excisionase family DNA binding protein
MSYQYPSHDDMGEGLNCLAEGRMLSVKDVIAYTGQSDTTVRREIRSGRLKGYTMPSGWRFKEADVERWIESYAAPRAVDLSGGRRLSARFDQTSRNPRTSSRKPKVA